MRSVVIIAALALLGAIGVACGGSTTTTTVAATVTVTQAAGTVTVTVAGGESSPDTGDTGATTTAAGGVSAVAVQKQGFSQKKQDVGYGLVLRNLSATQDALDVTINVNLLSRGGNIVKSDATRITVIPASTTYYLGGYVLTEPGEKVQSMQATIDIGRSAPKTYALPHVRRVRIQVDPYLGVRVAGEVQNTLSEKLSAYARIGVVLFDKQGHVVGGGFGFLDAPLPPGSRSGFDTGTGTEAAAPRRAAYARATIENDISS